MQKDFNTWNVLKQRINLRKREEVVSDGSKLGLYAHPREIWWFSTGINVGSEIDGKNSLFERPGIVLKTHNQFTSTIVPISSNKEETYFSFNFSFNEIEQSTILSQAKLIDHKRLSRKVGILDEENFFKLKQKFIKYFQYETPRKRGISEAEAISSLSIAPTHNLSSENGHRLFNVSQQAVFINKQLEVLILRTSEDTSKWLLPGGRIDILEINWERTLRREIKEEIGLENFRILKTIASDFSTGFNCCAVAYLCEMDESEFAKIKLSKEHTEYKFVPSNMLEDYLYYKKMAREISNYFK